jgi:hypothetical protein
MRSMLAAQPPPLASLGLHLSVNMNEREASVVRLPCNAEANRAVCMGAPLQLLAVLVK